MNSRDTNEIGYSETFQIGGLSVTRQHDAISSQSPQSGELPRNICKFLEVFVGYEMTLQSMSPERAKEIRECAGLTQSALGALLRLGTHGKRTVARWESGDVVIPGPVQVALEAIGAGWRPGDGQWRELKEEYGRILDDLTEAITQARTRIDAK